MVCWGCWAVSYHRVWLGTCSGRVYCTQYDIIDMAEVQHATVEPGMPGQQDRLLGSQQKQLKTIAAGGRIVSKNISSALNRSAGKHREPCINSFHDFVKSQSPLCDFIETNLADDLFCSLFSPLAHLLVIVDAARRTARIIQPKNYCRERRLLCAKQFTLSLVSLLLGSMYLWSWLIQLNRSYKYNGKIARTGISTLNGHISKPLYVKS